jgi:hypothetical protein
LEEDLDDLEAELEREFEAQNNANESDVSEEE